MSDDEARALPAGGGRLHLVYERDSDRHTPARDVDIFTKNPGIGEGWRTYPARCKDQ